MQIALPDLDKVPLKPAALAELAGKAKAAYENKKETYDAQGGRPTKFGRKSLHDLTAKAPGYRPPGLSTAGGTTVSCQPLGRDPDGVDASHIGERWRTDIRQADFKPTGDLVEWLM